MRKFTTRSSSLAGIAGTTEYLKAFGEPILNEPSVKAMGARTAAIKYSLAVCITIALFMIDLQALGSTAATAYSPIVIID
jgi:hypothetical protein